MEINKIDTLENFLKTIGKNIKKERKKRGKTQSELAFSANMDLNTISNIENGKSPARLDSIYKIAKVLQIKPYLLLQTSKIDKEEINEIKKQVSNINNKLDKIIKFTLY